MGRKAKDQRSRGQIVERGDKKWLVRVYTGLDAAGKREYRSAVVNGTISQAQQKRTSMLSDLDTDQFIPQSKQTLGEYITSWLKDTAPMRVAAGTLLGYTSALARVTSKLGHVRLDAVTPKMIQCLYSELSEDELSSRYIEYVHTVLKLALEQAVDWRLLQRNPAKGATRPAKVELTDDQKAGMAFTSEEADLFLEAAKQSPLYAMWLTFITAGLRPQEMFALKWADIETKSVRVQRDGKWSEVPTTVIKVQRAMKHLGSGKYVVGVPKTKKGRRSISIPQTLIVALDAHRIVQVKAMLVAGEGFERNDLIFPDANGKHLSHDSVRNQFHAICRRAKVKELKLYGLRHTHATILLASGVHLKVVSERLGHASIVLTADIYSHVLPEVEHETALTVETLLCRSAQK